MSTYILQKDLPDYKAGERFSTDTDSSELYVADHEDSYGERGQWPRRFVENNPEWFLKEPEPKEKIKVLGFYNYSRMPKVDIDNVISVSTNIPVGDIFSKKYEYISQILEDALNDCSQKKYTESDMRLCFLAGRSSIDENAEYIYKNFDDYIKQ